jgi:hypothetical protein
MHRPGYVTVTDEHVLLLRSRTRAEHLQALQAAWQMAQEPDHPAPDDPEPALSPYEQQKHDLARAWIRPQQAPWQRPSQPKYWNDPPVDPITAVTVPAKVNPRKGAGPISAEEIARYRAQEAAAFRERLTRRWISNLNHL